MSNRNDRFEAKKDFKEERVLIDKETAAGFVIAKHRQRKI